jgi:formylmethanofuran dehydrogenase subunit C
MAVDSVQVDGDVTTVKGSDIKTGQFWSSAVQLTIQSWMALVRGDSRERLFSVAGSYVVGRGYSTCKFLVSGACLIVATDFQP